MSLGKHGKVHFDEEIEHPPYSRHGYNLELLEETEVKRYTFEHDKSPPYSTYNSNHGLFGVTREIDMTLTRFHNISIFAACSPLSSPRGVNGILCVPHDVLSESFS